MGLNTVDERTKEVTEGWKLFQITDGKLRPLFFYKHNDYLECNKWIEDENQKDIGYFSMKNRYLPYKLEYYKSGFHFYINKLDALLSVGYSKEYVIKKVRVKNIVATGKQSERKVGVARKIFIED